MISRTNKKASSSYDGCVLPLVLVLLLASMLTCSAASKAQPKIEDYATIESICDGVPVYSFNNIMYVYGQSPDLRPGIVMQERNPNPVVKVKPKKSWEIKFNYCGAESEMTRRSAWNDSQPLLPIHLIDGDLNTCWSSWGSPAPDARPEWIRIDLPLENEISSVSLVCAPNFPYKSYGKALAKEIEILVSKDAWHWEMVYEDKNVDVDNTTTLKAEFKPLRAKQVWIKANNLTKRAGFSDMYSFSIGEVEIGDPAGNNLALVSRGAGVTVSSTSYGMLNDRYTQDSLWNTLQYDLGNKWVRLGGDNGSFMWHQVEHEKGKPQVDPVLDESITECANNGINVILGLDFKGNWLYQDPPLKMNWREARFREFNDSYITEQSQYVGRVTDSPEMMKGYLKYVEYMVKHFKDRVDYFEIGNEWSGLGSEWYMKEFFEPTYRTIKKVSPKAKVMLGSVAGFQKEVLLDCLGRQREYGIKDGKLVLSSAAEVTLKDVKIKDGTVSMDALNVGQISLFLRYQDFADYVEATYDSASHTISLQDGFLHEGWGREIRVSSSAQDASMVGHDLHMTVKLQGPEASFTVSDGDKSISTHINIMSPKILEEGTIRLSQASVDGQRIDNFQISDLAGKVIVQDTFDGPEGSIPTGWEYIFGGKNPIKPGWGAKIDGIGWHCSGNDANYVNEVNAFKAECESWGFKGKYFATEIYANASYPPGPPASSSDEQMAKSYAQILLCHAGLDMEAGPCHPHFTSYYSPQALATTMVPSQTVNPCQPKMAYYVWRNVATAMDDFRAAAFPVKIDSDRDVISCTFRRGDSESMVAAWLNGVCDDGIVETKADITLPGTKAKRAWVVDIMNGTEQELSISIQGDSTVIKGMLIKDYPVLIRSVQ